MLRSNRRDGTEQEEAPLGTRLGFLRRGLGGRFPHCSVELPARWEHVEAPPHALFRLFFHDRRAFLGLLSAPSGNASEGQTAGSSGWKMASWGQAGGGEGRAAAGSTWFPHLVPLGTTWFHLVPTPASLLMTFLRSSRCLFFCLRRV